jgi:hypothetical protein
MQSKGSNAWVVHKFGGSSVADAGCFRKVADILDPNPAQVGVVLSACKGGPTRLRAWSAWPRKATGECHPSAACATGTKPLPASCSPGSCRPLAGSVDQDRTDLVGSAADHHPDAFGGANA